MAKIIRFPVREQESVAYGNYTQLIEAALSKETLNFYMECIEESEKKGHFLAGESEKLLEQGRKRRLEMAKPVQTEKEVAESPGVYCYTPEMGQQKPDCQMEASRGYYGKHWYIDTPLSLKGRGITFLKKYTDNDFYMPGNYRVGWNEYRVTDRAFDKLKEQYTISQKVFLD